ncbi:bifunctional phosphopantothenoylcysteine decarboxylase/phosphopantothenate--cysteine ligase CoaBC [Lentilactobacillus diolivorans]|uniref:bifunctional phosphopantothenoylcysteine decarboxylase/phosphopantothenate--cysteine ligase CoaBC n=1 Tax=Lentilactobacillus diolivorans TaxID=179838 RepID=UPI0024689C47|nr:bifunctional phosphopantothenoylcysteine decarboxylase/phosphopantothenate--cysteine ligase CoaBC [Lentilactobacillus diolivorans]MDH5104336.1 bifunctional phosphopantothenoylcysteine decarboxylase/phosphopantothenate--cysteine ligase CoaBC [Lentilactobacillus diolivorans]
MFQNKKITLFVTGSIAVYKSLILTRLLVKNNNDVQVVMTEAAQKFVTPLAFQTLSKHRVVTDDFSSDDPKSIPHVKLADETDLAIVAPATANTIAKMADGIADNVVNATLLATTSPIFVIPAMNNHMFNNFATQNNLTRLASAGIHVMTPETGFLAEGYSGQGRMPEPETILNWVMSSYQPVPTALTGKKVVVTAGGTREPLDPVRYLTNHSSGKMGYAIAHAAQLAGAEVTLISANSSLQIPNHVRLIKVETAADMLTAVQKAFQSADVLIMSAAIADFRPAHVADRKIKKSTDNQRMTLDLIRNPDILETVGQTKQKDQVMIGFAAETNDLIMNAQKKIKAKNLDMIVANDVSKKTIGFNSDNNQVTFLFANGDQIKTDVESKQQIANRLVRLIADKFL